MEQSPMPQEINHNPDIANIAIVNLETNETNDYKDKGEISKRSDKPPLQKSGTKSFKDAVKASNVNRVK